ncbi:MAG: hypothetical protein Q4A16_07735 [Lautropia sp.]|nr:hypothetical protein [Lautropia sp.]
MRPLARYTEETRCFGPDQRLIGTLTLPTSPSMRPMPGLILLNAGVLPRIGPHRLNVELARTAAKLGISAIRFDFPGLGDSGYSSSKLSHDEQALDSIAHAMNELRGTPSRPDYFVIAGLCSGADVGLQMALQDESISGLFMIEPYYYPNRLSGLLRTSRRLREYGIRRALRRMGETLGHMLSRRHRRREALPMDPEENARPTPSQQEFRRQLTTLLQRGTHLELIYANTLMGKYDLWRHRRRIFHKLPPSRHFNVHLVPDTDHSFTRIENRQKLVNHLHHWLKHSGHLLGGSPPTTMMGPGRKTGTHTLTSSGEPRA